MEAIRLNLKRIIFLFLNMAVVAMVTGSIVAQCWIFGSLGRSLLDWGDLRADLWVAQQIFANSGNQGWAFFGKLQSLAFPAAALSLDFTSREMSQAMLDKHKHDLKANASVWWPSTDRSR